MNKTLLIFKKEMRDMFRDRRVFMSAFVTPVFLMILLQMLFGMLASTIKEQKLKRIYVVTPAQADPVSGAIIKGLGNVSQISDVEAGRKLVDSGEANLMIEFGPGFGASPGQWKLIGYYNPDEVKSEIALKAVQTAVDQINKKQLLTVLKRSGLPATSGERIKLEERDARRNKEAASSTLIGLLPYMIVLWAFYGGFSIASDLVAGEKERGTLETLLISPATRNEVALGKFLGLSVVCFLSSLTALLGVILGVVLRLPGSNVLFPQGFNMQLGHFLGVVVMIVPLVCFFAGLLLSLSAAAKSMREAQTYMALSNFFVLVPAVLSQFIGFTDFSRATWVRYVPVLNTAVGLREALQSRVELGPFAITIFVNLLLAALMLWIVVRMFNRERILARS